jgi:hypothetical protein
LNNFVPRPPPVGSRVSGSIDGIELIVYDMKRYLLMLEVLKIYLKAEEKFERTKRNLLRRFGVEAKILGSRWYSHCETLLP